MDFVLFGKLRPQFPETDLTGTCLVFDHTYMYEACKWLEKNYTPESNVYRLLIPIHRDAYTLASFLTKYGDKQVAMKTIANQAGPYKIVKMHGTRDFDTESPWPVEDDPASVSDLFKTWYHYRRRTMLPHPYSGLSVLQTYILDTRETDFRTQIFIACGKFYLPADDVYKQLLDIKTRNIVVESSAPLPIPLLLANGPWPYNPEDIKALLLERSKGAPVSFDSLVPWFKGQRNVWDAVGDNGVVTKIPYGTYPDDYAGTHKDWSSWDVIRLHGPPIASHVPPKRWECFDGTKYLVFDSATEYVEYWLQLCKEDLSKEVVALAEKEDFIKRRRPFIRKLYVQAKDTDRHGNPRRWYFDVNKEQKRQLLIKEFGSDEFSQTPVCEIGPDYLPEHCYKEKDYDEEEDKGFPESDDEEPKPEFVTSMTILRKRLRRS